MRHDFHGVYVERAARGVVARADFPADAGAEYMAIDGVVVEEIVKVRNVPKGQSHYSKRLKEKNEAFATAARC